VCESVEKGKWGRNDWKNRASRIVGKWRQIENNSQKRMVRESLYRDKDVLKLALPSKPIIAARSRFLLLSSQEVSGKRRQ
jgi:hypothetical protein